MASQGGSPGGRMRDEGGNTRRTLRLRSRERRVDSESPVLVHTAQVEAMCQQEQTCGEDGQGTSSRDVQTCVVCGMVLEDMNEGQRERHVNDCLDGQLTDAAIAKAVHEGELDCVEQPYVCAICGRDLTRHSLFRRQSHIERCCERREEEQLVFRALQGSAGIGAASGVVPSSLFSETVAQRQRSTVTSDSSHTKKKCMNADNRDALAVGSSSGVGETGVMGSVYSCIVCGRNMDKARFGARVNHLKACSKAHGLSPAEIAHLRSEKERNVHSSLENVSGGGIVDVAESRAMSGIEDSHSEAAAVQTFAALFPEETVPDMAATQALPHSSVVSSVLTGEAGEGNAEGNVERKSLWQMASMVRPKSAEMGRSTSQSSGQGDVAEIESPPAARDVAILQSLQDHAAGDSYHGTCVDRVNGTFAKFLQPLRRLMRDRQDELKSKYARQLGLLVADYDAAMARLSEGSGEVSEMPPDALLLDGQFHRTYRQALNLLVHRGDSVEKQISECEPHSHPPLPLPEGAGNATEVDERAIGALLEYEGETGAGAEYSPVPRLMVPHHVTRSQGVEHESRSQSGQDRAVRGQRARRFLEEEKPNDEPHAGHRPTHAEIHAAIRSNEALYERILTYEVMDVDEIMTAVRGAGVSCSLRALTNVLDAEGVCYRTSVGSQSGTQKRRRIRKKQQ